jgi:hypothetical protein
VQIIVALLNPPRMFATADVTLPLQLHNTSDELTLEITQTGHFESIWTRWGCHRLSDEHPYIQMGAQFCSTTSAHGFSQLAEAAPYWRRYLWMLAVRLDISHRFKF